jgi:hypothetical protein
MALDQSQHNELLAQNLARRRPQNAPRSVQAFTGEPRYAIVGTARDGRELVDPAASILPCAGFALHSPLMTSRISSWAARSHNLQLAFGRNLARSSCPTRQNHCSNRLSASDPAKSRKLPPERREQSCIATLGRNVPWMSSSSRIMPPWPSPESSICSNGAFAQCLDPVLQAAQHEILFQAAGLNKVVSRRVRCHIQRM